MTKEAGDCGGIGRSCSYGAGVLVGKKIVYTKCRDGVILANAEIFTPDVLAGSRTSMNRRVTTSSGCCCVREQERSVPVRGSSDGLEGIRSSTKTRPVTDSRGKPRAPHTTSILLPCLGQEITTPQQCVRTPPDNVRIIPEQAEPQELEHEDQELSGGAVVPRGPIPIRV